MQTCLGSAGLGFEPSVAYGLVHSARAVRVEEIVEKRELVAGVNQKLGAVAGVAVHIAPLRGAPVGCVCGVTLKPLRIPALTLEAAVDLTRARCGISRSADR